MGEYAVELHLIFGLLLGIKPKVNFNETFGKQNFLIIYLLFKVNQ